MTTKPKRFEKVVDIEREESCSQHKWNALFICLGFICGKFFGWGFFIFYILISMLINLLIYKRKVYYQEVKQ